MPASKDSLEGMIPREQALPSPSNGIGNGVLKSSPNQYQPASVGVQYYQPAASVAAVRAQSQAAEIQFARAQSQSAQKRMPTINNTRMPSPGVFPNGQMMVSPNAVMPSSNRLVMPSSGGLPTSMRASPTKNGVSASGSGMPNIVVSGFPGPTKQNLIPNTQTVMPTALSEPQFQGLPNGSSQPQFQGLLKNLRMPTFAAPKIGLKMGSEFRATSKTRGSDVGQHGSEIGSQISTNIGRNIEKNTGNNVNVRTKSFSRQPATARLPISEPIGFSPKLPNTARQPADVARQVSRLDSDSERQPESDVSRDISRQDSDTMRQEPEGGRHESDVFRQQSDFVRKRADFIRQHADRQAAYVAEQEKVRQEGQFPKFIKPIGLKIKNSKQDLSIPDNSDDIMHNQSIGTAMATTNAPSMIGTMNATPATVSAVTTKVHASPGETANATPMGAAHQAPVSLPQAPVTMPVTLAGTPMKDKQTKSKESNPNSAANTNAPNNGTGGMFSFNFGNPAKMFQKSPQPQVFQKSPQMFQRVGINGFAATKLSKCSSLIPSEFSQENMIDSEGSSKQTNSSKGTTLSSGQQRASNPAAMPPRPPVMPTQPIEQPHAGLSARQPPALATQFQQGETPVPVPQQQPNVVPQQKQPSPVAAAAQFRQASPVAATAQVRQPSPVGVPQRGTSPVGMFSHEQQSHHPQQPTVMPGQPSMAGQQKPALLFKPPTFLSWSNNVSTNQKPPTNSNEQQARQLLQLGQPLGLKNYWLGNQQQNERESGQQQAVAEDVSLGEGVRVSEEVRVSEPLLVEPILQPAADPAVLEHHYCVDSFSQQVIPQSETVEKIRLSENMARISAVTDPNRLSVDQIPLPAEEVITDPLLMPSPILPVEVIAVETVPMETARPVETGRANEGASTESDGLSEFVRDVKVPSHDSSIPSDMENLYYVGDLGYTLENHVYSLGRYSDQFGKGVVVPVAKTSIPEEICSMQNNNVHHGSDRKDEDACVVAKKQRKHSPKRGSQKRDFHVPTHKKDSDEFGGKGDVKGEVSLQSPDAEVMKRSGLLHVVAVPPKKKSSLVDAFDMAVRSSTKSNKKKLSYKVIMAMHQARISKNETGEEEEVEHPTFTLYSQIYTSGVSSSQIFPLEDITLNSPVQSPVRKESNLEAARDTPLLKGDEGSHPESHLLSKEVSKEGNNLAGAGESAQYDIGIVASSPGHEVTNLYERCDWTQNHEKSAEEVVDQLIGNFENEPDGPMMSETNRHILLVGSEQNQQQENNNEIKRTPPPFEDRKTPSPLEQEKSPLEQGKSPLLQGKSPLAKKSFSNAKEILIHEKFQTCEGFNETSGKSSKKFREEIADILSQSIGDSLGQNEPLSQSTSQSEKPDVLMGSKSEMQKRSPSGDRKRGGRRPESLYFSWKEKYLSTASLATVATSTVGTSSAGNMLRHNLGAKKHAIKKISPSTLLAPTAASANKRSPINNQSPINKPPLLKVPLVALQGASSKGSSQGSKNNARLGSSRGEPGSSGGSTKLPNSKSAAQIGSSQTSQGPKITAQIPQRTVTAQLRAPGAHLKTSGITLRPTTSTGDQPSKTPGSQQQLKTGMQQPQRRLSTTQPKVGPVKISPAQSKISVKISPTQSKISPTQSQGSQPKVSPTQSTGSQGSTQSRKGMGKGRDRLSKSGTTGDTLLKSGKGDSLSASRLGKDSLLSSKGASKDSLSLSKGGKDPLLVSKGRKDSLSGSRGGKDSRLCSRTGKDSLSASRGGKDSLSGSRNVFRAVIKGKGKGQMIQKGTLRPQEPMPPGRQTAPQPRLCLQQVDVGHQVDQQRQQKSLVSPSLVLNPEALPVGSQQVVRTVTAPETHPHTTLPTREVTPIKTEKPVTPVQPVVTPVEQTIPSLQKPATSLKNAITPVQQQVVAPVEQLQKPITPVQKVFTTVERAPTPIQQAPKLKAPTPPKVKIPTPPHVETASMQQQQDEPTVEQQEETKEEADMYPDLKKAKPSDEKEEKLEPVPEFYQTAVEIPKSAEIPESVKTSQEVEEPSPEEKVEVEVFQDAKEAETPVHEEKDIKIIASDQLAAAITEEIRALEQKGEEARVVEQTSEEVPVHEFPVDGHQQAEKVAQEFQGEPDPQEIVVEQEQQVWYEQPSYYDEEGNAVYPSGEGYQPDEYTEGHYYGEKNGQYYYAEEVYYQDEDTTPWYNKEGADEAERMNAAIIAGLDNEETYETYDYYNQDDGEYVEGDDQGEYEQDWGEGGYAEEGVQYAGEYIIPDQCADESGEYNETLNGEYYAENDEYAAAAYGTADEYARMSGIEEGEDNVNMVDVEDAVMGDDTENPDDGINAIVSARQIMSSPAVVDVASPTKPRSHDYDWSSPFEEPVYQLIWDAACEKQFVGVVGLYNEDFHENGEWKGSPPATEHQQGQNNVARLASFEKTPYIVPGFPFISKRHKYVKDSEVLFLVNHWLPRGTPSMEQEKYIQENMRYRSGDLYVAEGSVSAMGMKKCVFLRYDTEDGEVSPDDRVVFWDYDLQIEAVPTGAKAKLLEAGYE